MNKRNAVVALLMAGLVGVMLYGCGQVATTTVKRASLPASVNPGDPITSPEATLSGAVGVSSGSVDLNLGGIIPTGSTTAVATSLDRMAVYVTKGSFAASAGVRAAAAADWRLVDVGFHETSATPIDIAFILDNTGSMSGAINGVKNSIVAFSKTLEAAGVDAKFALVTYGDSAIHPTPAGNITQEGNFNDASFVRPVMNLGPAASLESVLASVEADGGGDGPENPLDAEKWALTVSPTTGAFTNLNWRTGAQKVEIIITDINGHQSVEADTSSNNKCTTTGTLEIARTRNFNAKVYAVSPNYTTSQWPYFDVRKKADGFGEGRTTAEAAEFSSGGAWIQFPSSGIIDLTKLGISTSIAAGETIRISSYTFENGEIYTIIVYYDVDGDGVADSYGYFTFRYSSTGTSAVLSAAPVKALGVPPEADDFKLRPNY